MQDQNAQIEATAQSGNPFLNLIRDFRFYWVAFAVILIDQLVKLVVKFNMHLYDEIPVFGELFSINFIENKGAAFGLTIADLGQKVGIPIGDETAKLILTLFSIFAVIVIIYLLKQVKGYRSPLPYFLALILGGAIGNIIDRVFYGVWFSGINNYEGGLLHGRVVDMFYLDAYRGELFGQEINLLPVFNIADAAITVGIIAILLFQRRFFRLHQAEEASRKAESTTAADSSGATSTAIENSATEGSTEQSATSVG